ncbi:unnamed protein product, partial [Ilex paraguariensis]
KSAGGVLLPKSAVKFERYLMGEASNIPHIPSVGAEVGEVEAGKKVLLSDINAYEDIPNVPLGFGLDGMGPPYLCLFTARGHKSLICCPSNRHMSVLQA